MAALGTITKPAELYKYLEGTVEAVEGSMSRNELVDITLKSKYATVIIPPSVENENALDRFIELVDKKNTKSSNQALDITLNTSKGKVEFKWIDKDSKPTKGDVGEAVIAAAICARFVFKHGTITPQRVGDILKTLGSKGIKQYIGKKGKYVETVFKSQNKGIKMYDDVRCYISLNRSALTAAVKPNSKYGRLIRADIIDNKKNKKSLDTYLRSACSYVNQGKVKAWAETVYTNKRYDNINIVSDGLSDQKGTKVDTRVTITDQQGIPRPVNINLSMKVDDVKQFGQVSGMKFSVQQELWKHIFGYTSEVDRLENKWNEIAATDLKAALNMVYDNVYKMAEKDIKGPNKEELVRTISRGLIYFATRNEEHVEMLNIGYGGTKIYNFDDMENVLMRVKNLNVTIKSQKNGYRQIGIEGTSPKNNKTKGLFQIRLRREPEEKPGVPIKYIRNLIEKNQLLGDLLAESFD